METDQTIRNLATLRLAVGASAWATPRLAGKAFGLDAAGNPQSPYLARLFGIRDIALGVGALSTTGEARRQWLTLGVMCDAADAAAGNFAGRGGYLPQASRRCSSRALPWSPPAWASRRWRTTAARRRPSGSRRTWRPARSARPGAPRGLPSAKEG